VDMEMSLKREMQCINRCTCLKPRFLLNSKVILLLLNFAERVGVVKTA